MRFARANPAETLLDSLTTAVVEIDGDLRVSTVNSACEHLFGVSRKNAVGQLLPLAMPQFGPHENRLREALDAASGFIEREISLHRMGEGSVTVDWTVTPTSGKKPGLLMEMQARDRHLRISRDELASASHEASREMVRGLAHEIKNPLGGIRGAAQLLERAFPDSEHREYTRVIIREVDRLQNLVNRMLGPNRLPRREPLNIHEVTEHVRQLVAAEAPAGVRLLRDYDPSIPDLLADREQLIQALLNLTRNALQAVGEHGQISLRTRSRRQLTLNSQLHKLVAQIDVEDTGAGIPTQLAEKIFFPMVTTRADGTGLGLPIAQHLIHSHGGVIECKSRPGQTVFSVFLPLEPAL